MLSDAVIDPRNCVGVLDPKATDIVLCPELARNAKLKVHNCSVEVYLGSDSLVKTNKLGFYVEELKISKSKQNL